MSILFHYKYVYIYILKVKLLLTVPPHPLEAGVEVVNRLFGDIEASMGIPPAGTRRSSIGCEKRGKPQENHRKTWEILYKFRFIAGHIINKWWIFHS